MKWIEKAEKPKDGERCFIDLCPGCYRKPCKKKSVIKVVHENPCRGKTTTTHPCTED